MTDLFASDEYLKTNVPVNWASNPAQLYIVGYYNAARLLRLNVEAGRGSSGELIYPIAFLYRHYLELRFKELVRNFCAWFELPVPSWLEKTHALGKIWSELKPLILKFEPEYPDDIFEEIQDATASVDQIDYDGTAFRYPTSKGGVPSIPSSVKSIGLENLGGKMHDLYWVLEGLAFELNQKTRDKIFNPENSN